MSFVRKLVLCRNHGTYTYVCTEPVQVDEDKDLKYILFLFYLDSNPARF